MPGCGHFPLEMVASFAFTVCAGSTRKWTHLIKFMSIKPPAHQINNQVLVPGSSYWLRSCANEDRPFEFVGLLPSFLLQRRQVVKVRLHTLEWSTCLPTSSSAAVPLPGQSPEQVTEQSAPGPIMLQLRRSSWTPNCVIFNLIIRLASVSCTENFIWEELWVFSYL